MDSTSYACHIILYLYSSMSGDEATRSPHKANSSHDQRWPSKTTLGKRRRDSENNQTRLSIRREGVKPLH